MATPWPLQRFTRVLERQDARALARTSAELSQATLQTVQRRMQAGAGSTLEEKKAQIALARARVAEEDATHELAVARSQLAATWGNTTPAFERAEGDLFARKQIPPFAELAGRLSASPEVLRRVSEGNLCSAEIGLAYAKRVPDLNLSAGPRWLEHPGEVSFVFGVAVPLPLFDGLHQELLHTVHELDALETQILPSAEDALSISHQGFTQGRFSYLDLLDAQRTFVDVRTEHLEAAASYHRFVLAIERLTGEPMDRKG